jgi:hypothetical protein
MEERRAVPLPQRMDRRIRPAGCRSRRSEGRSGPLSGRLNAIEKRTGSYSGRVHLVQRVVGEKSVPALALLRRPILRARLAS